MAQTLLTKMVCTKLVYYLSVLRNITVFSTNAKLDYMEPQYIRPDEEQEVPNKSKNDPTQQPQVIQPQIPVNNASSHMFQINFYRKFFELDTNTFFEKIKRALNPINKSTSVSEDENDDEVTELYGFIWITGTLIFLMFVSSTGANILSEWLHSDERKYEYSFELLTLSISLFYGYNVLVPLILYLVTTWVLKFPHRLSLTKMISVYGYTNILWFPITGINFLIAVFVSSKNHHFVWNFLEWVIVLTSGVVTGCSNLIKLSPIIKKNSLNLTQESTLDTNSNIYTTTMALLAVAHLIFTVLIKISFFGISI